MSRKLVAIHEAAQVLGVLTQTLRRWARDGLAALSGSTASSAGCEACGEEGSGLGRKPNVKPASVKQEVSFVPVQAGMSKSDGT